MEDDDETPSIKRSESSLDLKAYASLYRGRTRVIRLIFIADRCDNQVMKLEALRISYEEIKKGENIKLFKEVVEKIAGNLGEEYGLDQAWVDNVDRKANLRLEKLENQLYAAKKYMIMESIRMAYNNIGDFHYDHGHLDAALQNYALTGDQCATSSHILHMCLKAILVSIEMGQFSHVATYISKAEQIPDALDPVIIAKLRCAAGLAHLHSRNYRLAACKFLKTGSELEIEYTEVIAPRDVAIYGAVCALASFDSFVLKNKIIDNMGFRLFLKLVPEIWKLVNEFYASDYASCLEHLGILKANLLLDIHLHHHVETLSCQIRRNALMQYTHLFESVDLSLMAEAFRTDVSALEEELKALVIDSRIPELKAEVATSFQKLQTFEKQVTEYEKGLMALPFVKRLADLHLEEEMLRSKIKFTDEDKKNASASKRKSLEGEKKMLKESLSNCRSDICKIGKHTRWALEGMERSELENLLDKAKSDLSRAQKAHAELKRKYCALEKIIVLLPSFSYPSL